MNTITINTINDQEIGYICWHNPGDKNSCLHITVLHVHDVFRKLGYGTLLIKCMLIHFGKKIRRPLKIKLDDCSDYSGSTESIYYKLGFRCINNDNEMRIYIKSLFDYINTIKIKTFSNLKITHDDENFKNINIKYF